MIHNKQHESNVRIVLFNRLFALFCGLFVSSNGLVWAQRCAALPFAAAAAVAHSR